MLRGIPLYLTIMIGLLVAGLVRRELAIARHRRQYNRRFQPGRDGALFRSWAAALVRHLSEELVRSPELVEVPTIEGSNHDRAMAAVSVAKARFGLTEDIEIHLEDASNSTWLACAELPYRSYSFEMAPNEDKMTFHIAAELEGTRAIRIRLDQVEDPERLALCAAHEVAHHAIDLAGMAQVDPSDTERLAELAVVLAGYGQLLQRHCYREHRSYGSRGSVAWHFEVWGSLPPSAVAFLRALRVELRSPPDSSEAA